MPRAIVPERFVIGHPTVARPPSRVLLNPANAAPLRFFERASEFPNPKNFWTSMPRVRVLFTR
jgi:hypothetical protein